ncbi:MAG: hypothetical protein ACLQDY_01880 [Streptosporangiaceae bacterium]
MLRGHAAMLYPGLTAPPPGAAGLCVTCCGPARPGSARCYQCTLHAECAPGGLADLVVPVAYAPKGGAHATRLWQYKSAGPQEQAAGAGLRALLLTFLRDHGPCAWQRAGVPSPARLAVVPSSRGRPGEHPLRALIGPCLALPWAELTASPGRDLARDLDPHRFTAAPLAGGTVLLLDDTWTTGASAQSAAMVLRLAGAGAVIAVVLGRHLSPPGPAGRLPGPAAAAPFRPGRCAVHPLWEPDRAEPRPARSIRPSAA